MEAVVAAEGVVPATVGIVDGQVRVGLASAEIEQLATCARAAKLNLSISGTTPVLATTSLLTGTSNATAGIITINVTGANVTNGTCNTGTNGCCSFSSVFST